MTAPRIRTRAAQPEDAGELAALLNHIIDEGDKTAIQSHLDEAEFREWFITGQHCIGCVVAETPGGALKGFQAYERYHKDLPPRWADIATFVERTSRGWGIGQRLFSETLAHAANSGTTMLRAVVRAGNHQALSYYRGHGFAEPSSSGNGLEQDSGSITLLRPVAQLRGVPERPVSISGEAHRRFSDEQVE